MPTPDWMEIPTMLPASMKGYELFSWESNDGWVFTLITGTNRTKTFEEIISSENSYGPDKLIKITVAGVVDLKRVFDRLPAGEEIMWSGMDLAGQVPEGTLYFSFPNENLTNELIKYCQQRGIVLTSLKEP
jgi:hypothetical protein